MPKLPRSQRLLQELQDWEGEELEDLIAMLQGLLLARQQQAQEEPMAREDGSPLGQHGGRGHIELKWITDSKTGKTYGPYRYLRYWGMTRRGTMGLKSVYLGKAQTSDHPP